MDDAKKKMANWSNSEFCCAVILTTLKKHGDDLDKAAMLGTVTGMLLRETKDREAFRIMFREMLDGVLDGSLLKPDAALSSETRAGGGG